MRISLTGPQYDFVSATEVAPAMVAGYGAGKTHAGLCRILAQKIRYPAQNCAIYLPTYDMARTIGFPRVMQLCEQMRLGAKLNKTDATVEIPGAGMLIFRTMDNPERIIGYEVADSLVDELDTLPTVKARDVWTKIVARNRQKKPGGAPNTVGVTTTPEGFRFVYEAWGKSPAPGYRIIRASTYSNAHNLPAGYIDNLKAIYPSNLLSAYLDGEFVNLAQGSVYPQFSRAENACTTTIEPGEPLHIGMDFNVLHGAAVVAVLRDGCPHIVAELTEMYDTPSMIAALQSRYEGHQVYAYPDASGRNRKSQDASAADIALLRQARFIVLAPPSNPAVKDRIMAVNALIGDVSKPRRLRVNLDGAPGLVEALEQQAYDKNGEPDKTSGLDHVADALGYLVHYKWPIAKMTASRLQMVGI